MPRAWLLRLTGVLVLIACAVGAIALLRAQHVDAPGSWPSAWRIALGACIGLLGGIGFITLRAQLLRLAAKGAGCDVSATHAARLLCEGVCVEVVSWPGKVWADCWRAARLGNVTPGVRVGVLLRFRVATMLASAAMLVLGAAAFDVQALSQAWAIAAMLALGAGVVACAIWTLRRRAHALPRVREVVRLGLLATAGNLCDALALGCIVTLVTRGQIAPWEILAWHAGLMMLGTLSTLPIGLGVVDVGLYWIMTAQLNAAPREAIAALALSRATGPGLTLALGLVSHARLALRGSSGAIVASVTDMPTGSPCAEPSPVAGGVNHATSVAAGPIDLQRAA